jgi:hypothetical protein
LGVLGLLAGLLLETSLLIVRTNMPAPLDKQYGHLLSKEWDRPQPPQQQQQQQQPQPQHEQKQQAAGARVASGKGGSSEGVVLRRRVPRALQ